jgi:hypothetical protein
VTAPAALVIPAVLLGVAFAVAGGVKLRDASRTEVAAVDLGVPRWLAPLVARGLPWLELVLAALLLVPVVSRAGALVALVLLAVFTVAQAHALVRGRRVACGCFGGTGEWVRPRTLARNGALMALALALVVASDSPDPAALASWVAGRSAVEWLTAAVAALALLLVLTWRTTLGVLRQNGRLLARLDRLEARMGGAPGAEQGVPLGTVVPDVVLTGEGGEAQLMLGALVAESPLLAVFLSPGCSPCRELVPALAGWAEALEPAFAVRVLVDRPEHVAATAALVAPVAVLADGARVARAVGVTVTPSAAVVAMDRALARPLAVGGPAICELAERLGAPRDDLFGGVDSELVAAGAAR